jgi:hypothetical protein
MFSNLSRGSILQGVDRTDGMKWFTGSVESVVPSMSNQFPYVNVDIVANVNGKQRQFRGVHNNDSIADFGSDSIIIADNKDTLYNYVKSLLKISEDAVNPDNIKKHKEWIPQYRGVLSEMFPGSAHSEEVKELKDEVSSLKSQLAEAISLLKSGNTKPTV